MRNSFFEFNRWHGFLGALKSLYFNVRKEDFAECGRNVILEQPCKVAHPEDVRIGNNVGIRSFMTFISRGGRLIIQDNVDISNHLTIVTNAHTITPPQPHVAGRLQSQAHWGYRIGCGHRKRCLDRDKRHDTCGSDNW